ncbi:hypothetical protein [Leeuwenhoekiella sp. NPDC079379]|uniref:hypothetical protein n=1 Tax=Leeuwenhoekiella sp. NPDC079379 TaxID=3364122 RepID=UPI0037C8F8F1
MKTMNVNFGQSRLSRDEMRSIAGGNEIGFIGGVCSGDCNWNSQCGDGCTCKPYRSSKKAGYCD